MKNPIEELLTDELHPIIQLNKIRVKGSTVHALRYQGAKAWHSSHPHPSPGNQGAKQMKKPPQHSRPLEIWIHVLNCVLLSWNNGAFVLKNKKTCLPCSPLHMTLRHWKCLTHMAHTGSKAEIGRDVKTAKKTGNTMESTGKLDTSPDQSPASTFQSQYSAWFLFMELYNLTQHTLDFLSTSTRNISPSHDS